MKKYKLVLNCGSSSLKFALYENDGKKLALGNFEKIGMKGTFVKYEINSNKDEKDYDNMSSHIDAFKELFRLFGEYDIDVKQIDSIGHRIVHGGGEFNSSVIASDEVIKRLEKTKKLAPLHNKTQIEVIEYCFSELEDIKQVLCFDTSFHSTIPPKAYTYGIPYKFLEENKIRKYGAHGLSYQYSLEKYSEMSGISKDKLNLIVCHLGSGSSICAIENGKSVDTTMGLTPLGGLVMVNRCGDMDPAVVLYLINNLGVNPEELDSILNKQSGLSGITGLSNIDMREVLYFAGYKVEGYDVQKIADKFKEYSEDELSNLKDRCKLGIEVMVYRIKQFIGSYFAILGRIDAIIFTAGIGERSSVIRDLILENMNILKDVDVQIINADEEYIIYEEVLKLCPSDNK
jgi:acetate kinase